MWTCEQCGYAVTDEANRYCGRCGKGRDVVGAAYDVYLMGFDPARKINVIKTVRELTSMGLKDAKDLVESAPQPLVMNRSQAEADTVALTLQHAGGIIEVCPHGAPPSRPITPLTRTTTITKSYSTGCSALLLVAAGVIGLAVMMILR